MYPAASTASRHGSPVTMRREREERELEIQQWHDLDVLLTMDGMVYKVPVKETADEGHTTLAYIEGTIKGSEHPALIFTITGDAVVFNLFDAFTGTYLGKVDYAGFGRARRARLADSCDDGVRTRGSPTALASAAGAGEEEEETAE